MALTRPGGVPETPTPTTGRYWDASRVDCGFSIIRDGLPVVGFHVNLVEPPSGVPQAWGLYRMFPVTPERVFAGMEDRMVFLMFATEAAAEAVLGGYLS